MIRGSLGRWGGLRQIMTVLALVALVPAATLAAQRGATRTIRGIVVDSSGARVACSNVSLDNKRPMVSDDSGRFSLTADSGRVVRLSVRRLGYQEQELSISVVQDTTFEITLARAVQRLAAQNGPG